MFPYVGLLVVFFVGSLFYRPSMIPQHPDNPRAAPDLGVLFTLATFFTLLMIGLRYDVGGDWVTFSQQFAIMEGATFAEALERLLKDPAYTAVNWSVSWLGGGFWIVNLLCAVPFVAGLVALARQQPNPWLVLLVATPVLIILVGMGYTRQAVAVGCVMFGLAQLLKGKGFAHFAAAAVAGSLFHQTALILIPVVALFLFKWRPSSIFLLVAVAVIGYFVVLPSVLERFSAGYIDTVYEAKGAIYRVIPNAVAGAILLILHKNFTGSPNELRIWRGFAILSLLALPALWLIKSTIIVDRLSLYILPMQVVVLSTFPNAFGHSERQKLVLTVLVSAYAFLYTIVWLTFANHSEFWLPYRVFPIFS